MKKNIAIPTDEKGILDAHFGHCAFFELFTIENNEITESVKHTPPPHEPGLLPKWLGEKGIHDIIAGGMGQRAIDLFNERGINVYLGAPKTNAKEIVEGFLQGTLSFKGNLCDH